MVNYQKKLLDQPQHDVHVYLQNNSKENLRTHVLNFGTDTIISYVFFDLLFRSVPPCTTRRAPASSRSWWPKQRRTASRSRCPSTSSLLTSLMRTPKPALQPLLLASLPAGWWEDLSDLLTLTDDPHSFRQNTFKLKSLRFHLVFHW